MMHKAMWVLVAGGSAMLASRLVGSALDAGWRAARDEDPPTPESPDTDWIQALAWTAATGAALAVARVVAERGAAHGWHRVTGSKPPV